MSKITLPSPEQIVEQMKACRDELAALKKLLRLSKVAHDAVKASEIRQARPSKSKGVEHAE